MKVGFAFSILIFGLGLFLIPSIWLTLLKYYVNFSHHSNLTVFSKSFGEFSNLPWLIGFCFSMSFFAFLLFDYFIGNAFQNSILKGVPLFTSFLFLSFFLLGSTIWSFDLKMGKFGENLPFLFLFSNILFFIQFFSSTLFVFFQKIEFLLFSSLFSITSCFIVIQTPWPDSHAQPFSEVFEVLHRFFPLNQFDYFPMLTIAEIKITIVFSFLFFPLERLFFNSNLSSFWRMILLYLNNIFVSILYLLLCFTYVKVFYFDCSDLDFIPIQKKAELFIALFFFFIWGVFLSHRYWRKRSSGPNPSISSIT